MQFLNGRVIVKVGDLTKEATDAIVNAANSTLLGGGGVDGAIHRAGGRTILEECEKIRRSQYPKGLPTGEAVITTGGNLPARFVIHTVGPIFGRDKSIESEQLADCYSNSMALAVENDLRTIAFPSISTGAFGYPKDEAAKISSRAIKDFLSNDARLKEVRLVFFSETDAQKFLKHQDF
ncbi:MAG: O-acetyl-ADP-ribose deacetylase [Pyrinomonadaceae bacterium]